MSHGLDCETYWFIVSIILIYTRRSHYRDESNVIRYEQEPVPNKILQVRTQFRVGRRNLSAILPRRIKEGFRYQICNDIREQHDFRLIYQKSGKCGPKSVTTYSILPIPIRNFTNTPNQNTSSWWQRKRFREVTVALCRNEEWKDLRECWVRAFARYPLYQHLIRNDAARPAFLRNYLDAIYEVTVRRGTSLPICIKVSDGSRKVMS